MDICTPTAMQTLNGSFYELLDYKPEDVDVPMIAHSLALKCRWNGITNDLSLERNPVFYSVAQHSCHVHDIARDHKKTFVPGARWDLEQCPGPFGLFHDAGEGPYMDVPRPIKKAVPALAEIEAPIISTILATVDIPISGIIMECVRRVDNAMIFWERDALIGKPVAPYTTEKTHPGGTLYDMVPDFEPWSPQRAKAEFMKRYNEWFFTNAV